eukprot:TRINITY_DN7238_c0_g1_i1.p1 TRINITY_DN7238_c0_g1~~TRINITY_DN7238_c0_g1_i1.p1  ORF type:complete len:162 (-),score=22.59 TRINITY_DN7238_c0_g1_i1:4045-4530(-)
MESSMSNPRPEEEELQLTKKVFLLLMWATVVAWRNQVFMVASHYMMEDLSTTDNQTESSSKSKGSRKRPRPTEEIVACIRESTEGLRTTLLEAAEIIGNPNKKIAVDIIKELVKIRELNPTEVELLHEWLTFHKEMASIFLSTPDKRNWILRHLHRIRKDR